MTVKELLPKLEQRLAPDEYARGKHQSTGLSRWHGILRFFSIDCVKAGFLVKQSRAWYLTPEGERALQLGDVGLLAAAREGYKRWNASRIEGTSSEPVADETDVIEPERERQLELEEIRAKAADSIRTYIDAMTPYEFQDLAAALLRGMGYFTPVVAPPGKDGGIDIIAYRDPLGTVPPRIRVQIKHKLSNTSPADIRELIGILQKEGDVGIFICSSKFTAEAESTARNARVHVELIDFERFVQLWQEFYPKMVDEDKALLPLLPVYFLAPGP